MKKYFILLLLPFLLTSCFFAKGRIAKHLTVESKAIPPDFGKDDT
ncbi:hypothetical protein [Flavobacterium akiainvivens]|nr:hypothetical protein [Flavobacterium akiainvivens]SFQ59809.1 hypothetical protein SAMN05444144_109134 [Flavobacterium akiainvivens]